MVCIYIVEDVYEQNSVVKKFVDDWTAELVTIASNDFVHYLDCYI